MAILFFLLVFFLALPYPVRAQMTSTITLNSNVKYQTWTGWEATDWAGEPGMAGYPGYINSLLDKLVNDYGISRIRLEVGAGVQNDQDYFNQYMKGQMTERMWNHCYRSEPLDVPTYWWSSVDRSIDEVAVGLRSRLAARGEKLHVNLTFVSFNGDGTCPPSHPTGWRQYNDQNKYANLILAAFKHMQTKYGFVPDTVEIMLEPDLTGFDGGKMGDAIKTTQTLLANNGFTPKYVVPSTTDMDKAPYYFDEIKTVLGDAFVRQWVSEISYHRYQGSNLSAIGDRAATYNIGASMLEQWFDDNIYQSLFSDMTTGRNTAWQDVTTYGIYNYNSSAGALEITNRSKYIRQYSRYIRPGAVRIETSTPSGVKPVAFINKDGKYAVVVYTSTGGRININGLPAGTYGVRYTTDSAIDQNPDPGSGNFSIGTGETLASSIPSSGVITFFTVSNSVIPVSSTPTPIAIARTPTPTLTDPARITPSPVVTCFRKSQGDANCDGLVDGIDYSIWLNSQCNPVITQICSDFRADFNGDEKVNDADFTAWLNNRNTL